MLKLKITGLCEGLHKDRRQVVAADAGLGYMEEFQHLITVHIEMEKVKSSIFMSIRVEAQVDLSCDRCLETFSDHLTENDRLVYTTDSQMNNREDEGVYFISESITEIDITDPVRQVLILMLPTKRLCNPDCKGLCARCGANLNLTQCACKNDRIDPRWEKLKQLLN